MKSGLKILNLETYINKDKLIVIQCAIWSTKVGQKSEIMSY